MSFYDSASLAFLPSGGAGKDGKAYSIKPVPEYGNELVTNGGFDTDSYWTKETGWSIANGKATQDGSAVGTGGEGDLVSGGTIFQIGKTYLIKIDIVDYVSGDLKVTSSNIPLSANKDGSYYTYYTAATAYLHIRAGYSSFIGSIDNVSVKEVIVDGDFTFSRGSNLTATRVDGNGLIEKGRENLLTYSNDFSNAAWNYTTNGVTRTASSITDPDGGTNAWEITTTATNEHHRLGHNITSGLKTISFYAKANGYEYVRFWAFSGGNTGSNYFHLSGAGTAVANGQLGIASIESVGNGWYRCQGVLDPLNSSAVVISPAPDASKAAGTGTYLADGTSGIYLYNAQLEAGLVATEYIESGASTGKAGILEDSPRFDYSGGASCPSLLLEPSRTNLIRYSEYFDEWGHYSNATAQLANVLSPEGKLNVYEFTFDGTTNGRIQDTISVTDGNTYTFSVYLKNKNISTPTQVWIGFSNPSSQGEYVTVTNEWQRFETTQVANSGSAEYPRILCNGVGSIYGYGAQMEEASYPTSYIPNHSGGSVTRGKDESKVTDLISNEITTSNKFTYFVELEGLGRETNPQLYLNDLSNNRILSLNIVTQKNRYGFYSPDASNYISSSSNEADGVVKIAVTYDGTNFKEFFNGVKTGTLSASVSNLLNEIDLTYSNSNAIAIHKNLLFPTALSDTDLEILTGTSYESFAAMATALNYTTYE